MNCHVFRFRGCESPFKLAYRVPFGVYKIHAQGLVIMPTARMRTEPLKQSPLVYTSLIASLFCVKPGRVFTLVHFSRFVYFFICFKLCELFLFLVVLLWC